MMPNISENEPVLHAENLVMQFGGLVAVNGVSLDVYEKHLWHYSLYGRRYSHTARL